MTKEGLKHRLSETISKFGRGMSSMSCVNPQALPEDKDCERLRKPSEMGTEQEQHHSECMQEDEERELLDTFEPHRIRRSISFTGFGIHEVQHLRSIAEGCGVNTPAISRHDSVLSEPRRSRCHSFGGVKNKKLVEITRGANEQTAVIDGLLTTT
ncbi:hypothetical protein ACROYT_G043802, partial [Oculina patagonica]